MKGPPFPHLRDREFRVVEPRGDESILFLTANHRAFRVSRDLGSRIRQGLHALTGEERVEWNRLADLGALSESNAAATRQATVKGGASLALNVNLTSACNLACTYCFAHGGGYGRIAGKLGQDGEDAIFRFLEKRQVSPGDVVRLEFFGGEPLMNLDRIEKISRRAESVEARLGIRFARRISTNLTVLPTKALDLMARHRFVVSVSIDGGPETQDRNRPTKAGSGTFKRIIQNCRRLREAEETLTLVARMTVTGGSPSIVENVRCLHALDLFDYFQLSPGVVESEPGSVPARGCDRQTSDRPAASDYALQMTEMLDSYLDLFTTENRFKGVLEVELVARMILDGELALSHCAAGRTYFTFSPDDSIMPCHRLVGREGFQVGQGRTGLQAGGEESLDLWRGRIDDHQICSCCWGRYLCAGGCRHENLLATGELNRPAHEQCERELRLLDDILGILSRADASYRSRDRRDLGNLFPSCGRPVIPNSRPELPADAFVLFRPLS